MGHIQDPWPPTLAIALAWQVDREMLDAIAGRRALHWPWLPEGFCGSPHLLLVVRQLHGSFRGPAALAAPARPGAEVGWEAVTAADVEKELETAVLRGADVGADKAVSDPDERGSGTDMSRSVAAAACSDPGRGGLGAGEVEECLRGVLLIPCRTVVQGAFPLNGTYFQVRAHLPVYISRWPDRPRPPISGLYL